MDLDELIIANEACASKLIEGIYATSNSEKEVSVNSNAKFPHQNN